MTDIAALQSQLDALRAARANGMLRVTIANGMDVTYKSDSELSAAIGALQAEIERATGTGPPRNVVVRSNKGW
jgi:hypothetical protein